MYAGVRDPTKSAALQTLASALPESKVHIVKWAAADAQLNAAVAKLIGERHGHIDVAIANAGKSRLALLLRIEMKTQAICSPFISFNRHIQE